jgi:hypothetical protein
MRVCLSFLVVELIRAGLSPQAACVAGMRRLMACPLNKKKGLERMYAEQIAVGVVAMDSHGNIGACSTINESNPQHDGIFFPTVCWRGKEDGQETDLELADYEVIEVRPDGASY